MGEALRRLLARLAGRPARPAGPPPSDRRHDRRLDEIERQQLEVEARIRLLEIQADLRTEHDHDRR